MTVRLLIQLQDARATTTTAKSGRQHVRKLPESSRAVNRSSSKNIAVDTCVFTQEHHGRFRRGVKVVMVTLICQPELSACPIE
jgi:hypothetical protein